jgi:hypothetical protein
VAPAAAAPAASASAAVVMGVKHVLGNLGDIGDLDVELQAQSRQGMVGVQGGLGFADLGDGEFGGAAVDGALHPCADGEAFELREAVQPAP